MFSLYKMIVYLQLIKFLDDIVVGNTRKISDLVKKHPRPNTITARRLSGKPLNK